MSQVMMDVILADEVLRLYPPEARDSIREVLTESLLKIHNIDRSDLDTNLYLYTNDFENFDMTIKNITEKTTALQDNPEKE